MAHAAAGKRFAGKTAWRQVAAGGRAACMWIDAAQGIDIDWGEVFTLAARPVVADCIRRGWQVHFDCDCPPTQLQVKVPVLQATLYRVMHGFAQAVRPGGFIVAVSSAEALPQEPGLLQLDLRLASSDALPPPQWPAGTAALDAFVHRRQRPWGLPGLRSDSTRLLNGAEGRAHHVMFHARLVVPGRLQPADADARGAMAWLVAAPPHPGAPLAARLQRLGWQTRRFESCTAALQALGDGQPMPARVVVLESQADTADEALRLWQALPAGTQRMFGVLSGSATIVRQQHRPELHLHVVPVSANELLLATRALHGDGPPGDPPTLLPQLAVPQVLVVDDDETNRIVAGALLAHAGFDAVLVPGGLEAIAACERQPPQAVLMDIDMHPMDGFETTRQLQALQRVGRLAPFPILAATAGQYDDDRVAAAGMAGLITKPLSLPVLQQELVRVLKGSLARR